MPCGGLSLMLIGAWLTASRFEPERRINDLERMDKIRNFCIIAHIDHGKSTLADRLLKRRACLKSARWWSRCSTRWSWRERGITIKSKAVHMHYKAQDGETIRST
ncbi:MAG: GTP-binding protein [Christensenellales bacterium]